MQLRPPAELAKPAANINPFISAKPEFSSMLQRSLTRYLETQADKSMFRQEGLIDPHATE